MIQRGVPVSSAADGGARPGLHGARRRRDGVLPFHHSDPTHKRQSPCSQSSAAAASPAFRPSPSRIARSCAPRTASLRRRCCSDRSPDATSCSSPGTATAIPFRPIASTTGPTCGRSRNRGASAILAVASVGVIRGAAPGDLVLPHQLIDYTHDREATFFDGGDQRVVHVDFTHPYTPALRASCLAAARAAGIPLADGGVYGAVSGPRLETAAEIDRMERDGATLVGMTGHAGSGARPRAGAAVRGDRGGRQPRGGTRRLVAGRFRWKESPRCWRRRWTRSALCSNMSRR